MGNIAGCKIKNYNNFVNVKNLNKYLINNFDIFRREKLTSFANKVERKIV